MLFIINKLMEQYFKIAHTVFSAMLITVLLSTISSCGFKLRGDYLIAPQLQTLYVSSVDRHGELTRLVKKHLKVNHINIITKLTDTTPELRILKDKLDRRTLSVFKNGQVAEYEIIYTVNYQLRLPNAKVQNFSFDLNRDYQDDPNNALAKSRELSLMIREMRIEAADRILRDLASVKI
jgi:LPS-assembly lipoprotein